MRSRALALAVLLPLLAACSHSTDPSVVEATQAELAPTTTSYQGMTFKPVAYPSSHTELIGTDDPVFDFGSTGKSYYKAIELPRSTEPYVLEIVNYTTHPGRGMGFRIFLPSFIFLDKEKTPVSMSVYQGPLYVNGDEAFLQRYVQYLITPDSNAHYVIVYTTRDDQLNGIMATYGQPGVAFAAGLFIPIGGQKAPLRGTPDGKIGITTKPPAPKDE